MPTGYTSFIADGISFERFALVCARAFGACVIMRDDPINAPIPERFEPDRYHSTRVKECIERLQELSVMSEEEAQASAAQEYEDSVAGYRESINKSRKLKSQYTAMLAQVMAWTPPTPDHQGLKDFMIRQIDDSMHGDCSDEYVRHLEQYIADIEKLTADEWKAKSIQDLQKSIAYHSKKQEEENARTASRSEWISQLRASLASTTEVSGSDL